MARCWALCLLLVVALSDSCGVAQLDWGDDTTAEAVSFTPATTVTPETTVTPATTVTPVTTADPVLAATPEPPWTSYANITIPLNGTYQTEPVLVAYAYSGTDSIQIANFEYFLAAGMIAPSTQEMHWCLTISTTGCGPCKALDGQLTQPAPGPPGVKVSAMQTGSRITMLHLSDDVVRRLGAHNVTVEYFLAIKKLWYYKFFVFINSSTKGPYHPAYMPPKWHWTHAYFERMKGDIHAVGSSLTCLPDVDAGGPGPRLESWAYAVDTLGMQVMLDFGVLDLETCSICVDPTGRVVNAEYGLSIAMLDGGLNIATLLSKYRVGTDWRNESSWFCNNNIHPSRHGTYDHIEMHPYETIFVKSTWHVADHYTKHYTKWRMMHLSGSAGTEGVFDPAMYLYGITLESQEKNDADMAAFNLTSFRRFFTEPGNVERAIEMLVKNKSLKTSLKRHARHAHPRGSAGGSRRLMLAKRPK